MSRSRILSALAAALILGACSDTQSPSTPQTEAGPVGEEAIQNELQGVWGKAGDAAALKAAEPQHSPFLCNQSGRGPECMQVFHSGTLIRRVYHEGRARGTGCSRSVIKIAGVVRGRSGFVCHVRNDVIFFTWAVNERWSFGTRIQVDFTGGGTSSPAGSVFTTNW